MDIASGTIKFAKSFEEWNFSSILGGNDIKLCFHRICNIALPPQSLRDVPPLIHQTFMISVGGSVTACGYCGGIAPRDI